MTASPRNPHLSFHVWCCDSTGPEAATQHSRSLSNRDRRRAGEEQGRNIRDASLASGAKAHTSPPPPPPSRATSRTPAGAVKLDWERGIQAV